MPTTHSEILAQASQKFWQQQFAPDNSEQMQRLQQNLLFAIEEVLTPRQRQILLLHFFQNMSVSQIASHLRIAKSTVSRSLTRSIGKLEQTLHYSL